jgi:DNA-binding NarL/FixJ family response regulator
MPGEDGRGAAVVIDVLLADDHLLVRSGLETLISAAPDMRVVAVAADGAEAAVLAAEHHPDVILMDLSMPVLDGVGATRRILGSGLTTQILVLTSSSDRDRVMDALDAGAVGYLLKDSEPADLLEAIRAVVRGESPLDPRVARTLLHARKSRPGAQLSEREREVLALVGRGLANKQVARNLRISERTVKAHLTNIFQRIGVRDRTSAALWAQRNVLDETVDPPRHG